MAAHEQCKNRQISSYLPACSSSYSRQEFLEIGLNHTNSVTVHIRLIPAEISRTVGALHSSWPGGSAQRWKKDGRKHVGERAKLRLRPHRLSLHLSLANKMDEFCLHISKINKRINRLQHFNLNRDMAEQWHS